MNGKLVPGVGGGVSQFTTTLFNASYYAGLEDVEHKPHSFYFSRYPAVIESTIYWPQLDFKFRNNTPHGVLIDTSYTGSSITVSIWSTKIYDSVKTEYGPRRNVTQPKTVYLKPGPDCISAAGGVGFAQDAFRVIKKDGKVVKREKFSWRYDAEPRFICAPEPGPDPDAKKAPHSGAFFVLGAIRAAPRPDPPVRRPRPGRCRTPACPAAAASSRRACPRRPGRSPAPPRSP